MFNTGDRICNVGCNIEIALKEDNIIARGIAPGNIIYPYKNLFLNK
jgi:hypothetical protein